MKPMFTRPKRAPKRVVYAEGEDERVLRAVQVVVDEGLARPTLIGRPPSSASAMLLHKGEVDGMLCGTWGTTAMHLHYIDQVIGLRKGTQDLRLHERADAARAPAVHLVDTHVNYDPTAEQLAEIT
jgi:phosphotransacetylase